MGPIRVGNGADSGGEESPTGSATSATIVIALCVAGPELANLAPTDAQAWAWYLAAMEIAKSLLCLVIAQRKALRLYSVGAAIWFATQAADELTNGNLFQDHQWEYPLLAVFAVVLWLINKRTT